MTALLYVVDPMCSWCWGFTESLRAAETAFGAPARLVLGGLAADSDEPMPEETRAYVRAAWDAVEARTGARFNRDFWTRCAPRRSTYPSCRSVIAAEALRPGAGREMLEAVQRAYYLEARNPSDVETLTALAGEIGLDPAEHGRALAAEETEVALREHFALRDELGATGFPSLGLELDDGRRELVIRGYADPDECVAALARPYR